MLNSQYQQTSATNRVAAGLTFLVLIVFALAMAIFSRNEARAQNASGSRVTTGVQDEKQQEESVQKMDQTTRPTILYKEKAQYTKEARDNKIEGNVILSVVFGADANLGSIRVVRALPDGLTEEAVKAARKIRFKPAEKDGEPVSVRGSLEYSFRLDESDKR